MLPLLLLAPLLLPLAQPARAGRVPGSPFPVGPRGLNCTDRLLVLNTSALSPDDAFTALTLQGVVSKACPRVYRLDPASDYALWLAHTAAVFGVAVDSTFANDLAGLVRTFAPTLAGYVTVSLTDNSTNVAVAAAAAMDVIAVTPANAHLAAGAGLRQVFDLRGRDLAWALATFNGSGGFAFSPRVTVLQQASKADCMGDYAIASGALQWWRDDVVSDPLAGRVWGALAPPFAALGWGPDERGTVGVVSALGGLMVASDWASNLDVLSQFDVPALAQQAAPPAPPPPPQQQHTVAFVMTDGDNLQWLLGGFATGSAWWGSPARGSVPMGWTLSPAAADLAPAVVHYLYANASSAPGGRDVFVGGVSGAGYFYPDAVPPAGLPPLAGLTAAYAAKAGLRIVNVMAAGDGAPPPAVAEAYLAHPELDALLWYNFDNYAGQRGAVEWVGGKPVVGARFALWGDGSNPAGPTFKNVTGLADALLALPRDPTSPDGYSLVPVHAWSHSVADVAAVAALLAAGAGGGVQVVPPDEFVARIIANVARPPASGGAAAAA